MVTSVERARDLKPKPVVRARRRRGARPRDDLADADLTTVRGRGTPGARAFEMAGVKHADIDLAMIYDSFTYTVLLTLEDLGFCAKGEGGAFVSGQRTAPGGDFPMNTNGGGLSYTHPGMYGIFAVIEAVRQLRGDYADQGIRQVPDCELAVVHGTGGVLSSAGTAIWGGHRHGVDRQAKPLPDSRSGHAALLGQRQGTRDADSALRRLRQVRLLPARLCPHCSRQLTWEPVSGRGRLHAFTSSTATGTRLPGRRPYVVALVELDEGARMMSNLVGVEPDPEQSRSGCRWSIVYETDSNGTTLPKFKPA